MGLIFYAIDSCTMKYPFPTVLSVHVLASLPVPICVPRGAHRLVWYVP